MRVSVSQLRLIQEDFIQEYLFALPYSEYVNGCGISSLRILQDIKKNTFDLKDGESLDDLCLDVMLKKELPLDLKLPIEYNGVRVFYEVVGEITPL